MYYYVLLRPNINEKEAEDDAFKNLGQMVSSEEKEGETEQSRKDEKYARDDPGGDRRET